MIEVRFFLANLLCVFIPLFGVEWWQNHASAVHGRRRWKNAWFVSSMVLSAVLCTLFDFYISPDMKVNLSIVSLTIGFFLLDVFWALSVVALYVIVEVIVNVGVLSHGTFHVAVIRSVLHGLPMELFIVGAFAFIMTACSIGMRDHRFSVRTVGYVVSLLTFTTIDFAIVSHMNHFEHVRVVPFSGYVVVFNFVFLLAARIMVGLQKSNVRRMEDIRVEKLELVSQLAASVAHEIRNPITVVRGFAQLLMGYEYGQTESKAFLTQMIDELDKAELVISDYLQLSQNTVDAELVEIDFTGVVLRLVDLLQPYALSYNVSLKGWADDGVVVMGNHVRLTQAVANLVKNAIESHDRNGTVSIQLKQRAGRAALTISDSGRGMAPETIKRLGAPYYSTTSRGTGLGLTLVYKVVQEMEGTIDVRSSENIGTTFMVILPAVRTGYSVASPLTKARQGSKSPS